MKGQEWKGQDPSPLRYLLVSATTQAGSRCVSSSARHPRAQAVVTPTVGFVQRGDDVLLLREPSALIISMVQTRNSPHWLEGAGAECTPIEASPKVSSTHPLPCPCVSRRARQLHPPLPTGAMRCQGTSCFFFPFSFCSLFFF